MSSKTSWKAEVQTAGDGDAWNTNACRFATQDEALAYVEDLMFRWTAVKDTRAVECDDAVNYRYANGRAERIEA